MSMHETITLSYDEVRSDIEGIVHDVRAMRMERMFLKTLGLELAEKIKEREAFLTKRLDDPFRLVFVGDFKRGKTTLINALLGEALLPMAVTPETVTINQLSYAETPRAEAVLQNGQRATLDLSDIKRDVIMRILPELPAPIQYLDIKSNNTLLEELSIVDTPGIGDLMRRFDEQVTSYLLHADAIVYVASARAPLSAAEQEYLSTVVLPQSFSRMVIVINMADTLKSRENIAKIQALTCERARFISDHTSVYSLSALDELCRKQGLARPEPSMANALELDFDAFETALRRDVLLQKDLIKSLRVAGLADQTLRDFASHIELVQKSLEASAENLSAALESFTRQDSDLRRTVEGHKASVAGDISNMKAEAGQWMTAFMTRLRGEVEAVRASAPMQDVQRHFQFFMTDIIKSALAECVRQHQQAISDGLASSIKDAAQAITRESFGELNARIADSVVDISVTGIDIAGAALEVADQYLYALVGIDVGLLAGIGNTVMGFIRQKAMEGKQKDFLNPILEGFDSITESVLKSIHQIYDRIEYKAMDLLEESYQKQAQASLHAIHQAQEILADETTQKADVIDYLAALLSMLDGCRKTLAKYK